MDRMLKSDGNVFDENLIKETFKLLKSFRGDKNKGINV